MSEYRVRPVKGTDVEAIIAIDSKITGRTGPDHAGFWRGLLGLHVPREQDEDGAVRETFTLCEVAETAGGEGIAGFIIGDVQSWQFGLSRHGRIVTIGVHPDHQRKGVATALAGSLIASFRKMDLPFIHCLASPGDPLGYFFESLGFASADLKILQMSL